jgi:hypothetical protein
MSRDYLERTIATVRNHAAAKSNVWPQWANTFADEIERLWMVEVELTERIRVLSEVLPYEIGEDTYRWLPEQIQELYAPIHEDEAPTLERCFRRKGPA